MRHRKNTTEVREQCSIFYRSPGEEDVSPRPFEEFYTHMFMEDVSRALLSNYVIRHDSSVSVEIAPANADLKDKLCTALDVSRQGNYHRDLAGALSEFLRLTMVEICIAGRAVFEIAYLRPKPDEPSDSFDLVRVNPRQIIRRWGRWYQIVPPKVAHERGVEERIPLPCENLAVFTLPNSLAQSVSRAMEALSALSNPRWHSLALQAQSEKLPYDFSAHERSMQLALAESVQHIGWTARGSFNDKVTSYYPLRQDLRFKLFALKVREALLAQLNTILQRVGLALGWSAQLIISGLGTHSDLDQALAQLASGKKPFTEIMNAARGL